MDGKKERVPEYSTGDSYCYDLVSLSAPDVLRNTLEFFQTDHEVPSRLPVWKDQFFSLYVACSGSEYIQSGSESAYSFTEYEFKSAVGTVFSAFDFCKRSQLPADREKKSIRFLQKSYRVKVHEKKKIAVFIDYLPGRKTGGPLNRIVNLVDALGDEFDIYNQQRS